MTSNIVEIDNLSFGYKGRLLHKNINMVFPRGKVVAIMGGSGSGKTTLLRLIPQQGGAINLLDFLSGNVIQINK